VRSRSARPSRRASAGETTAVRTGRREPQAAERLDATLDAGQARGGRRLRPGARARRAEDQRKGHEHGRDAGHRPLDRAHPPTLDDQLHDAAHAATASIISTAT
jgi:hypothetical protein